MALPTFTRSSAAAVAAALIAIGLTPDASFAAVDERLVADYAMGVERTYTMPARDGVVIDAGRSVRLARVGNVSLALSLECPQRGKLLEWLPGEQRCFCPKHKARFTAAGAHSSGRRTTDFDRVALRAAQGRVIVSLAQPLSADTDEAAWNAAALVLQRVRICARCDEREGGALFTSSRWIRSRWPVVVVRSPRRDRRR